MISRALARDIVDFRSTIESHLARMIEVIHKRLYRLGPTERDTLIRDSLVLAFRRRAEFDPQAQSVMSWFALCVEEARIDGAIPDADELAMLTSLAPAEPYGGMQVDLYWIDEAGSLPTLPASQSSDEGWAVSSDPASRAKTDALQKPGKECPPCWRCRYFDGWLPSKPPQKTDYSATELGWICYEIDQRKIEIANYVRGEYPEELLED